MRLMGEVKIRRDRDKMGVSFAEVHIYDDGSEKSIDVYKVLRDTGNPVMEKGRWGVEIYQGENYIWDSKARSYSRHYLRGKGLPAKYKPIVEQLKKALGGKFN